MELINTSSITNPPYLKRPNKRFGMAPNSLGVIKKLSLIPAVFQTAFFVPENENYDFKPKEKTMKKTLYTFTALVTLALPLQAHAGTNSRSLVSLNGLRFRGCCG